MYWPVEEDLASEMGQLGRAGQRAIYEEIRNLKEAGAFGELLNWVASKKFDEWYSDKRRMRAYLYRNIPLSPSMYVIRLSITAVLRKPLSATRKPRSVSSSGLSFGPGAARMPLKKFAGIELWVILHGVNRSQNSEEEGRTGRCIPSQCGCLQL